ncbi:MAG: hypothetical protein NTY37_05800 [Methanothrix sp.]|nr:hypothetical protein [Methanothrix sp.]
MGYLRASSCIRLPLLNALVFSRSSPPALALPVPPAPPGLPGEREGRGAGGQDDQTPSIVDPRAEGRTCR